jgi:hypothetical protein
MKVCEPMISANELKIDFNQAIELNAFLLNEGANPCNDGLVSPAVETMFPEPMTLPSLETI